MKKRLIMVFIVAFIVTICFIEFSKILVIEKAVDKGGTEIQKLYFEGNLDKMTSKADEREISVKYKGDNQEFEAYAKIKLQGTSSLYYEKKNYTIKLYKDEDLEKEFKYDFGWGKQNKYCLKANWVDKTHARNIVSARLVADVQRKYNIFTNTPHYGTIDGEPVEIYLNEKFLGLYTLNIPKDAWMFNMDEYNKNHIVLSANDAAPGNWFTGEADYEAWEVEVGEENQETLDKLNRVVDFVRFSSDEEFRNDINEYFNLDSLLNYYVMMQFGEFNDNVCKNMLLVTYDGKVWYTSLYDLDTTWGTKWDGLELADYNNLTVPGHSRLWQKLEKSFPNELADRYFQLRKNILTSENVKNNFEEFTNSIPVTSFEKEKKRWDNIPGYDLEQIDEFLEVRVPFIDDYFAKLYTYDSGATVVYKRNSNGTVTAKVKNAREDVIILGGDEFTFKEDGSHTFHLIKFNGEKDFIIAEAKGVRYKFGA